MNIVFNAIVTHLIPLKTLKSKKKNKKQKKKIVFSLRKPN